MNVTVDVNATIISSFDFDTGGPYDEGMNCIWHLTAPIGKLIRIKQEAGIFGVSQTISYLHGCLNIVHDAYIGT